MFCDKKRDGMRYVTLDRVAMSWHRGLELMTKKGHITYTEGVSQVVAMQSSSSFIRLALNSTFHLGMEAESVLELQGFGVWQA
jgi:hypothetical protein